jgi:hypothetical protein
VPARSARPSPGACWRSGVAPMHTAVPQEAAHGSGQPPNGRESCSTPARAPRQTSSSTSTIASICRLGIPVRPRVVLGWSALRRGGNPTGWPSGRSEALTVCPIAAQRSSPRQSEATSHPYDPRADRCSGVVLRRCLAGVTPPHQTPTGRSFLPSTPPSGVELRGPQQRSPALGAATRVRDGSPGSSNATSGSGHGGRPTVGLHGVDHSVSPRSSTP